MQFYLPCLIIVAGFLGLGVFLLSKEIAFANGQAPTTARVVGKYFSFSNTQSGIGESGR
jgi:hypothetical protein